MTILKGHFDGHRVVLDEPMPSGIPPKSPVKVVIEDVDGENVLDRIARLAIPDDDLPADYSQQHDHYVKGTPRE